MSATRDAMVVPVLTAYGATLIDLWTDMLAHEPANLRREVIAVRLEDELARQVARYGLDGAA